MKTSLTSFIPLLGSISRYNKELFRSDLTAGVTVAVMLIPQGMAYSVLAGLPPIYGLYASIIPILLYAIFGTSGQLAVGPVAMVSLLIFTGVGALADVGSDLFIQLAILAAFGVGVVQLAMGLFRMGFLVNFLSHPVLSGFTSAAAIIIGTSQLKSLFGVSLPSSKLVHEVWLAFFGALGDVNVSTMVMGLGSVAVLIGLRRWNKRFPGALAVVVIGTALTAVLGLDARGVAIVGKVPEGLPSFGVPVFSMSDLQALLPTILAIALVGYMESIAVAKAVATRRGYKVVPNQELIGLGLANIGGSFFQSFPTTGGLSRTAVNDQAGAETGLASIYTVVLISLTVLFLTPWFYYLPKAVLAAIIMVAVSGLFDAKEMKHLWKTDRRDFLMLAATFVATLTLGIEEGIGVGVLLSIVAVIYSSTQPHTAELGRIGESDTFRNVNRYKDQVKVYDDILVLRFDSLLFFGNVEHFSDVLQDKLASRGESVKLIVLDAASINTIDSTGMHTLEKTVKDLRGKGIEFRITGVIGPVRDKLHVSGLVDLIGRENFFFDVADAVDDYQGVTHPKDDGGPAARARASAMARAGEGQPEKGRSERASDRASAIQTDKE